MQIRTTRIAAGTLLAAGLLLTACGPKATSGGTGAGAPADGTTTTTQAASSPATPAAKQVPNLVGKGLQAAQDAAQAAGFYNLASHDALGRDRHQILDRDWKVCTQTPSAGTSTDTATKLDFGAVKLDETCPKGGDTKPPAKTGKVMPDFTGKGLAAARNSLPSDASVTTKDASSQDRTIFLESNWKVCTQDPKPGAAYTGQPVTLTAVKTDETCP